MPSFVLIIFMADGISRTGGQVDLPVYMRWLMAIARVVITPSGYGKDGDD